MRQSRSRGHQFRISVSTPDGPYTGAVGSNGEPFARQPRLPFAHRLLLAWSHSPGHRDIYARLWCGAESVHSGQRFEFATLNTDIANHQHQISQLSLCAGVRSHVHDAKPIEVGGTADDDGVEAFLCRRVARWFGRRWPLPFNRSLVHPVRTRRLHNGNAPPR